MSWVTITTVLPSSRWSLRNSSEGLVHQQHRRIGSEGTGHADALALTAGELVRIALRMQARVEADQLEQLDRPLPRERLALAVQQRDRHHVVDDPLVREEPDLLDHIADVAAQLHRVGVGHVAAVDADRARRRLDQPVDHLESGGLPAP
jgi:hypothetical protein